MIPRELTPATDRPRRLVLWRHGRTEWNRIGIAQGHANVPLDEVGVAQASRAAPFLASYDPAFIWSSDLTRARQTAEHLAALTGREVVLDPRLREFDVGVRQGMTFEQFREAFPDLFPDARSGGRAVAGRATAAGRATTAAGRASRDQGGGNEPAQILKVPGAEGTAEVLERMVAVLTAAVESLGEGQTGVLVGHGASMRTGLLGFFGVPHELREIIAGMANCAWTVLEQHQHRGWQIIDYNAQTLPEPLELADDLASP